MTKKRKIRFDTDKARRIVRVPQIEAPKAVRIPIEAQMMLRHAMMVYEGSKRDLQVRIDTLRQGLAPEGFVLTQVPLSPANGQAEFELIFAPPPPRPPTAEK